MFIFRSTGKSTIFEAPIQAVSHNLSNDNGVGRFTTNGKLILLLHDTNLDVLVKGKDVDKLKAITRSEPITAKVHSTTVSIPPIHLIATSNRLLLLKLLYLTFLFIIILIFNYLFKFIT